MVRPRFLAACVLLFVAIHSSAQESSPTGIVRAARAQIGRTVKYDPAYRTLSYPNGDPPVEVGVCTDVVIRALRASLDMDLQRLVHEDMRRSFTEYPRNWGLKRPDRNIDHRRVPNLTTFFERSGWSLPVTKSPRDYRPGDLITCTVPPNLPHIMIVSDRTNREGRPLVIHNIGSGTREEDRLFEFPITGHFRIPATATNRRTRPPHPDPAP
jgi:uncharacterized protein YijF (DUF1287 family)